MNATGARWIAATAMCLAIAPQASALHYVCELHGTAQFDPGLSVATDPTQPLDFAFQGDLTNCQGDTGGAAHLCAVGKLHVPSCLGNITEGEHFVICAGACESTPGGDATCADRSEEPIIDSSFWGACAGVVCTGKNLRDGAAYAVVFDQATIAAALDACNPVAPGAPLTSGRFDGFELREHR
jgi:hypothetical protein